jgi:hypothetical protein
MVTHGIYSGCQKYVPIDFVNWNDPLKLHKSEQSDQSVLRGIGG